MRWVELRRHTDNDGDELTARGVADAEAIGREGLRPPYAAFVSSGAARATQMLTILREAAGQDDVPISEVAGLRSTVEDRWRDAAKAAGKGATVEQIRGSTRTWSTTRNASWARRCGGSSSHFPTVAGPWSSATARRTRQPWRA